VIAFDIRDASGALVAIHERDEGKDGKRFVWKQPDGTPGLDGTPTVDLPLYGIERMSGRSVVVSEGEKAAEALISNGIVAVGTVTGASSTPSAAVLADLAGKIVYLWPDADKPGREHMTRIAKALQPRAAALYWIEPTPGSEKGWDAADAIAELGADGVRELINDARLHSTEPPIENRVWTVARLAAMPSADEEYIVADGILTRGGKLLIYAKSGAGKTTALDWMAAALATGKPFLGRYAVDKPRRVLVVQGELSLPEMASHAQQLVGAGYDSDNLLFARMTDLKLPGGEDRLRELVIDCGASILALDPWYRLFDGESSDKPEQVGMVFDACDRLLDAGLIDAVLVVHHANVTGLRTAGSWVFEGWPSTILRLEKVAGIPDQRVLSFEKIRAPSSTLLDQRIQIALGEQGYLPVDATHEPMGAGAILAEVIVREAGGQLHRKELLSRVMARGGVKERAANKYLGDAVQAGNLRRVQDLGQMVYQLVEERAA
jgi:putative DNA primase/helicase